MSERDPNSYLSSILDAQTLKEGSDELSALHFRREQVERLLTEHFVDSTPWIRYGGSKAKHTMVREAYDLDIACFFARDDARAGATLKDIYENVAEALRKEYVVDAKASALRLRSTGTPYEYTHVDVVPGRFIDGHDGDVFLFRNSADKGRQKTNLDVQISYIRASGVRPAIRLAKLWNVRNAVNLKTFVLELLAIDLLSGRKNTSLSDQLHYILTEFRDRASTLSVKDPANPEGNDLSELLGDGVRSYLSLVARSTLQRIDASGWETLFGPASEPKEVEKQAAIRSAPAILTVRSKPWLPE